MNIKNHHTNNSYKNYYANNFMIFAAINQINKHKAKIYNQCAYALIIIKQIYFFSSQSIRMSGNNINFNDKKNKKSDFYKNKEIFYTNHIDVNKILVCMFLSCHVRVSE